MLGGRHLTLSPKENFRITQKEFINRILREKNMSQMDLLREIQRRHPEEEDNLYRFHLNYVINQKMIPIWARRIEEALELEKGTLDRWLTKEKEPKNKK